MSYPNARSRWLRHAFYCLVCLLFVPASPSGAAPPVGGLSAGDLKRQEGRRHFQQGVALYEEGNFAGALAEFQAAYNTAPAPSILYNIGLTYRALYRYPDAISALQRYLIEGAQDGQLTPQRREQLQRFIEEMKSLLAPITLVVSPRTAKVHIDGRETSLPDNGLIELAAGSHTVEAVADGHQPQRREITVVAGEAAGLELHLVAIPRTGKVRLTASVPDTRIIIDGRERGKAPLEIELDVGGHQLEARADGYEPFRSELMLAAGQQRNLDLELRRPPPADRPLHRKWWFWTGLGTAVASGTVAALLVRPGTQAPASGSLPPNAVNVSR
jgi:tetratricopeptide (TPR) repeat protein